MTERDTYIASLVRPGSKVFDYGCGAGEVAVYLAKEKDCQVVAYDISESIIEQNKANPNNIANIFTNVLPSSKEHFDYVLSTAVLEHTHNPGQYLTYASKVLKKQSKLILTLPNIMNPLKFFSQMLVSEKKIKDVFNVTHNRFDKANDHIQAWNWDTLCRLVASCGFDYEFHRFLEGIPVAPKVYLKLPFLEALSYSLCLVLVKKHEKDLDKLC